MLFWFSFIPFGTFIVWNITSTILNLAKKIVIMRQDLEETEDINAMFKNLTFLEYKSYLFSFVFVLVFIKLGHYLYRIEKEIKEIETIIFNNCD